MGWIRRLFGRQPTNADIQRELDAHVAMEREYREERGLDPTAARRTANIAFGGMSRAYEDVRDVRGMTFRESLAQDLRIGLRMLVRSPGYSLAAIAILALGIGANTAMFSVINGVLLEPLPFRAGEELVLVRHSAPRSNIPDASVSINELFDYRARLKSVSNLVEYHQMNFVLLKQGDPDRVDTGVVSANFFDMLGIKPLAGRTFVDTDDDLGAPAVLVLSYEYWRDKFGSDTSVVGRKLEMNNRTHEVVGVLPPYPQYPRRNDVYMPTSACPFRSGAETQLAASHRTFAALSVFGRLEKGRTIEQATAEIASIAEGFPNDYANDYTNTRGFTGQAQQLDETLVTGARTMLYTLVGITALVLLITCANVANLALARTVRRSREMAVRMALGAGRTRLMRQLVTESVLLSSIGGLAGLGLAWLSLDLLVGFIGRFTSRTGQIDIDGTVLAFTAAASLLTGVAFGLAPAFSTGRKLTQAIRDGGSQAGESGGRQRARSVLVVAQVAVTFALLVGAALLLKSFHRLSSVPLGFNSENVMTAAIFGNFSRAQGPRQFTDLQHNILDRLRATPGVRAAAATGLVPQLVTQPVPPPIVLEGAAATEGRRFEALNSPVSEGFFEALDVPLLAGRDFSRTDPVFTPAASRPPGTPQPPLFAIINRSMAEFWNGADPIGRRFARPAQAALGAAGIWFTVIGIVPDFHLYNVDAAVAPQFFFSIHQQGGGGGRLIVRADGDPAGIAQTIRSTVHSIDSQIPVEELLTLDQLHGQQLTNPAVTTALLAIFSAVALLVTLAGLAGLVGTSVSQRTREFGLRMALGASRFSVLRMVLGQGLLLTAIGLALGVGGAYVFSQLVTQFLFETTRTDIAVYVVTAFVFIAATLIASVGPARRATGIDPLKALRTE